MRDHNAGRIRLRESNAAAHIEIPARYILNAGPDRNFLKALHALSHLPVHSIELHGLNHDYLHREKLL